MPMSARTRLSHPILNLVFFAIAAIAGALVLYRAVPNPLAKMEILASWTIVCLIGMRTARRLRLETERFRVAKAESAQAARLSQLTSALSHARTHAAAVEAALQEPLHALSADAGMVIVVDRDGRPTSIARAVGYSDEELAAREPKTKEGKTPASVAIGRGAPVFVPSRDAYLQDFGSASAKTWSFESLLAVPLLAGSRVIAVVVLEWRRAHPLKDADRDYIDVVGARAAQALDRTYEFESALRARAEAEALRERADLELAERQNMERALRSSEARYRTLAARTTRLHGMAAALSEAATLQAVARAVVQHGRNVLGAAGGEVMLLSDDRLATLHSDGPAPAPAALALQSGLCATEAIGTRAPVFVASFEEWQERFSRSATIAADGGYVSSATLPLLGDGAVIGVLAFHFTAPVNFDDEYRSLLLSVAQQCAQALDRARSYEAAQAARAEAEAANRTKDEFVSIVSHELRTPLNAILGWTSMLQQGSLDESMRDRALQSIGDNAQRQLGLVQDLLDFSRLQAGRLPLDMDDVDLRAVLRGVVETLLPTAAASGLQLNVQTVPPLRLRGDARRLEQVFFNLLGNALKFTPRGGEVRLGVRPTDRSVEIVVSDTGEGIDAAFLPHMFDAFRQADTTRSSRHGGVGLGLSIAKELIEAHHGTIRAESGGPGTGATFVVTLPVAVAQTAPLV
jgi:signal transduction histidine kinase